MAMNVAGSTVARLQRNKLLEQERVERRQALGFLERNITSRLLEHYDQMDLRDFAIVLRSLVVMNAGPEAIMKLLPAMEAPLIALLKDAQEGSQAQQRAESSVWPLYVFSSMLNYYTPSIELVKGLVDNFAVNLKGTKNMNLWRVAQALAQLGDMYKPSPPVVHQLHLRVESALNQPERNKKVHMYLWMLVRLQDVVAPDTELVARLQSRLLQSLTTTKDTKALVQRLFVMGEVANKMKLHQSLVPAVVH